MFDDTTMPKFPPATVRPEPSSSPIVGRPPGPRPFARVLRFARRLVVWPFERNFSAAHGASDQELVQLASRSFRPARDETRALISAGHFFRGH